MHDDEALAPGRLKVLLDITNKCNLRCVMCHFSFDRVFYRPAEHMTPVQFRRIAEASFRHAHTVVLSAGSEPTVSPHFTEILAIASEYPLQGLQFLTNGQRLDAETIAAVLDSAVTQIDVSIDGATAKTYEAIRRGGRFDRLVANLRELQAQKRRRGLSRPLVQFNVTLMRSNLHELERFVDLAESCGVERIGARHLMPYQGLDVAHESLSAMPREANQAFQRFLRRIERSDTVRLIAFPDLFDLDEAPPPDLLAWSARQLNRSHLARRLLARLGEPPLGYVDLPAPNLPAMGGAVEFSGWALDRQALRAVVLAVRAAPAVGARASTPWRVIEVAEFINGSRPDVAARFGGYPGSSRAGWTCVLDVERALAALGTREASVHVFALNARGSVVDLGVRQLVATGLAPADAAPPALCCPKPFESLYINVDGQVYPYPDCWPDVPSGNLLDHGQTFEGIWHGPVQTALRSALREGRPPAMCRTCPNFINRRVDDPAFFAERAVESIYPAIVDRGETRRRLQHLGGEVGQP
ncbi:MAG: radical SAM protein [Burkholderiales bacterium]|nr:radical SAM protein [Burkholderiales bacterium]